VLGFVPSQLEGWAQIGAGMLSVVDSDFVAAFDGRDTFRILLNHLDVERQLAGRDILNQSLYVWAKTMLPNYILSNLGDRMEMAHSVEGRLPFLDHYVVEEAARTPVSMKINGMTEKHVLREAARPVVTDSVYKRGRSTRSCRRRPRFSRMGGCSPCSRTRCVAVCPTAPGSTIGGR
jgi:asparagine synthase (glutamine-hydrolysing)